MYGMADWETLFQVLITHKQYWFKQAIKVGYKYQVYDIKTFRKIKTKTVFIIKKL